MRAFLSPERVRWAALALLGVSSCTPPTFRPDTPRRAEDNGSVVEIVRADLRHFVVDVGVLGPTAPPGIEGAWVSSADASDGSPCARRLVARAVEPGPTSGTEKTFVIRFDRALLDALATRSFLELRVIDDQGGARCVSLPLSGPDPEQRWTLEPWGADRPFVGHSVAAWFPLDTTRFSASADLVPLRLGRWWGPVRLGAGAGVAFTCCASNDPNSAVAIPVGVGADAFPVVVGRMAVGLGASYQLRPTWFLNDSARGFELVHGPVGSIELAFLPHRLPGFLEGPRAGTIGVSFSIGRWLPDGGATILGASLSIN